MMVKAAYLILTTGMDGVFLENQFWEQEVAATSLNIGGSALWSLSCKSPRLTSIEYLLLFDHSAGMGTGNILVDMDMHDASYRQKKAVI
ncbi:uncharacterized protein B0H64DRAFT_227040 [Chaetomium fimeti]|uniref:Uncharacterized protein n=1 Tax=Chaetomium fimeti TaxID=1854472 RepID=A0AAE0H9I6_9PEZI|nr:hypothetical protein B0H64DRAFT_227040 [Chaetomium fimeti]